MQSMEHLFFSPDRDSKCWRISNSKFRNIFRQHNLWWQRLLWMMLTNNTSALKQTTKMRPKCKPLNGRNNHWKMQKNWLQTSNRLHFVFFQRIRQITEIDENLMPCPIKELKVRAWKRLEKNLDLVPINVNLKKLGHPQNEVLLTSDKRSGTMNQTINLPLSRQALLVSKYWGNINDVNSDQIMIPKQLVSELLRSLHWDMPKYAQK